MSFTPDLNKRINEPKIIKQKRLVLPASDDPAHMIHEKSIKLKPNWFTWLLRKRTDEKRNNLIMFLGQTRSGKSYSSISLGYLIDQNHDFNSQHIIFKISDLIQTIQTTKEKCTLILDETGAELNSRKFASTMNILTGALLQTWGSRYINLIMNLPSMNLTDKTARTLTSFSLRMRTRGYATVYSHWYSVFDGKPFMRSVGTNFIQSPLDLGMPKKHYLWPPDHVPDGEASPCYGLKDHDKKLCFQFWNKLIYEYECKKRTYQTTEYQAMQEKILSIEGNKITEEKKPDVKKMVANIVAQPEVYILDDQLSSALIQTHFSTSPQRSNQAIATIRKLYDIQKNESFLFALKNKKPIPMD
jgi:hypothetical protein|tara:strand:- start:812 stop:1885 length:1074 start_codon:yes stop_codon:yes gene_type:complete